MKKIVVTGGLGFIGSNLIDLLIKKNFWIFVDILSIWKKDVELGSKYSLYIIIIILIQELPKETQISFLENFPKWTTLLVLNDIIVSLTWIEST